MRKIRVKNKHLIFALVFALAMMGTVSFFGGNYLFYRAQRAFRAGDHVEALAYYDAFIERYPRHSRIPEALYWSADLLPSFDTFAAIFFPLHSSVTSRDGERAELPEGSLTRIDRYMRIQEEYPRHWAAAHVDYQLADAYHTLGDPCSEDLYLQALHNERATRRLDAALRLVQIYEGQNRLDEALAILEYCEVHLPNHSPIEVKIKLGDIFTLLGDYSGARQAYEEVLVMAEQSEAEFHARAQQDPQSDEPMEISVVPYYERQIADKLASLDSQESGAFAALHGQVTLLGKPLPGVNVYANRITTGERSYYGGRSEPGLWVTSEDGSFSGTLPKGTYEFGIGLNYQQAELVQGSHLQIINGELDLAADGNLPEIEFRFVEPVTLLQPTADFIYTGGPITIEWQAYPGAHRYEITVSGGIRNERGWLSWASARAEETEQTKVVFDQRVIASYGLIGYDGQSVEPAFLIARPESYDQLGITVRALDEYGNTLASSGGLHFGGDTPIMGEVVVKEGLRSPAEQLLLDRKYDEAVKLLEERVEEDPSDVDALWILARIYFSGTHATGEDPWDRKNLAHLDLKRSLETLQRIQDLEPSRTVEDAITTVGMALEREQ